MTENGPLVVLQSMRTSDVAGAVAALDPSVDPRCSSPRGCLPGQALAAARGCDGAADGSARAATLSSLFSSSSLSADWAESATRAGSRAPHAVAS